MAMAAAGWPPPPIALNALDLGRMSLIRQLVEHRGGEDHSRWVLGGPSPDGTEPWVYKVWNPSYVRRDTLGPALALGLYGRDVVPAFRGMIIHGGVCRGYAMARWGPPGRPSSAFVHALWEGTRASRMFAFQYRRAHTRRQGDTITLIDLEAAFPVERLAALRRMGCEPEDRDYADWAATVAQADPGPDATGAAAEAHLHRLSASTQASPTRALDWIARKADGARVRTRRLADRLLDDRRGLIER
jgi:hypothetical protein